MIGKMNRRDFALAGTAAGLAAASGVLAAQDSAPAAHTRKTVKPVVVASANGNIYKNGGEETCVEKAFRMMQTKEDGILKPLITFS